MFNFLKKKLSFGSSATTTPTAPIAPTAPTSSTNTPILPAAPFGIRRRPARAHPTRSRSVLAFRLTRLSGSAVATRLTARRRPAPTPDVVAARLTNSATAGRAKFGRQPDSTPTCLLPCQPELSLVLIKSRCTSSSRSTPEPSLRN